MPPIVTAFEITPTDCKVAQLTRQKTLLRRRALLIPFPPAGEDESANVAARGQAIREALRQQKIQAIHPVLIIPKHSVTVRAVFLPTTEEAELESMAAFEAQKIIPFDAERHVISHCALARESIQGTRVLITAVDEPVINEAVNILLAAGIEPALGEVSTLSLYNAWRYEVARTGTSTEGLQAIIHIGSAHTEIILIHKGALLVARSFLHGVQPLLEGIQTRLKPARPVELLDLLALDARDPEAFHLDPKPPVSPSIAGGVTHQISAPAPAPAPPAAGAAATTDPPTEPGATAPSASPPPENADSAAASEDDGALGEAVRGWVGKLLKEVRLTFDFARRTLPEPGALQRIWLTGEGSLVQGLDQSLTVSLGAEVTLFSPLSAFAAAPKQPGIHEPLLPVFSTAAGGALRGLWPEALEINLLPRALVRRQERQALRLSLMLTAAMLLIAAALGFIYFSGRAAWQEEALRRYTEYNQQLEPRVKDLSDKERKVEILRRLQRDRASALAILEALSAYPKAGPAGAQGEIVFTRFTYTSGDEVAIEGHAVSLPAIHSLVTYLEGVNVKGRSIFRSVKIEDHRWDSPLSNRPRVLVFQIKCFLREGASR